MEAKNVSTIILKLGTSSIINPDSNNPFMSSLSRLAEIVVKLRTQGHRIVLVSSGAVGLGMKRINLLQKPKSLSQIQAVAAIGQGRLMSLWDSLFSQFDIAIAQVLLTKENISNRTEYVNVVHTLRELLEYNVLPIVNENDTVSTEEIRIGDNDTLAAYVAGMLNADWLFLLTDVDCLYSDDPRRNACAKPLHVVENVSTMKKFVNFRGAGTKMGTGGMQTKIIAAELATAAGCKCVILASSMLDRLEDVIAGDRSVGTTFLEKPCPLDDRKWWILHGLNTVAKICVNEIAAIAISSGYPFLPEGITDILYDNEFMANQCVIIVHQDREIARGIVNFSSSELEKIKGSSPLNVHKFLGYDETQCIINRGNMVLLD